jgi:hypothetical protein
VAPASSRWGIKAGRLEQLAQIDQLALGVGHLDPDRRLAGDALDHQRLGLQAEAKIVEQAHDPAVLDPGGGAELESGHHRPGMDLDHVALDAELLELGADHLGPLEQLALVVADHAGRRVEQVGGWQAPAAAHRRQRELLLFGRHRDHRGAGRRRHLGGGLRARRGRAHDR